MRRPAVAASLLALVGCFDPTFPPGSLRCGAEALCPSGYACREGLCVNGPGPLVDAPAGGPADAPPGVTVDAPVSGGPDARPIPDAPPQPDGCAPGTFVQCQSETVALFCGAAGYEVRTCEHRCNAGARRCEQCDPARATQCSGDDVVTCTAGGEIAAATPCPAFCLPDTDGARCAVLLPTNLPADLCDAPAERPRRITADVTIDTDTCTGGRVVPQQAAPSICLLEYTDLVIEPGVLVTAAGRNALALAADTITHGGYLVVSASGVASGSGSVGDGTGGTTVGAFSSAGGGAGFATPGAKGGTEDVLVTVPGGAAYGNAELRPLVGGSKGGVAGVTAQLCNVDCPRIAEGGGGGGALQLVGCRSIRFGVASQVLAVGGGGRGGFQQLGTSAPTAGGGAGGGSGGAILVESPRVEIGIAAFFAATGGGGGGGGGLESGTAGGNGESGQADRAASGGLRGSPYAGRGGAGGVRDAAGVIGAPPVDGEPTQLPAYGAGGGGGAAGRIRFNTSPASPVDPRTFIILPYPSVGTVAGH
jgi:hypothetical protein